ncbi:MAG: peptidoglycan DD-metalloendopeptidase family protein [Leptospiraceae bacterium]|nr:peptidoglycan DD-metalloendopeptidase family protein [Leptospiraceae bacterium]
MIQILIILSLIFNFTLGAQKNSGLILKYLNRGDYKNAEKEILKGLRESPEKEWLYTNLAWAYFYQNQNEKAILTIEKALDKWPKSESVLKAYSGVLSNSAGVYIRNEENNRAKELLKKAYDLYPVESTYIWYGIVQKNLGEIEDARAILSEGMKKYPKNESVLMNAFDVLAYHYKGDGREGDLVKLKKAFEELYQTDPKPEYLHTIAILLREEKKFSESISLLEQGKNQYKTFYQFAESLPYVKLLYFRSREESASPDELKEFVEDAYKNLNRKSKSFSDQFHYKQIIHSGLRKLGDLDYFELMYDKIISMYPKDPSVYDNYGFLFYVIHRLKGSVSGEIREKAISFRKKALALYEKQNPGRGELKNISFPMKGDVFILSSFSGTGMTHNGFANYCYDFIAVNEAGEMTRPGSDGSKNEDYYNFGSPVYAVEDGIVEDVKSDEEDNLPGGYSYSANYITLGHKNHSSFYAHLKKGSIPFRIGDKVRKGELIGLNGNSGMSSESHLHFCLNDKNWVSLPFRFKKSEVRNGNGAHSGTEPYSEGDIVIFR